MGQRAIEHRPHAGPTWAPAEVSPAVDAAVRAMLEAEGYDLILAEYVAATRVLRLYIDRIGEGGVGIDDCTQVSRWVSDLLDAEGLSDRIPGNYNLEVSSPGLDRPLVRPRDFARFVGRDAKVTTEAGAVADFPSRKRFTGKLLAADEGGVDLEVDGQNIRIPYPQIEHARLVPEL